MTARSNSPLIGAVLGAMATVVVLMGAVAISDSPQQLTGITQSVASSEIFEIVPPAPFLEEPQSQALAPATGIYEDQLQVTYEVHG